MRKITVLSMITLDGVMQAPGGPQEDTSGGFQYGGWVAPFTDDEYNTVVQEELNHRTEYLLGRKTFDIWEDYWPNHADMWPGINTETKYVLSNTKNTTDWQNTIFIRSVDDIREVKATAGPDIQVWGSSQLVQLLLQHDLVDELRLKIHPIMLGGGKKLFDDKAIPAAFSLTDTVVTSKGVIIASYQRAGEVKMGFAGNYEVKSEK